MRVAVVVTARPSWAKLQTICEALRDTPGVELQIVACASALLERYGRVVDVITAQGFPIAAECWTVHEGENLVTSAKETGALISALSDHLRHLRPSCLVVCADRHEVLGAAQAGAYLHIPVVHIQGGEKTGSIDDKVRDSVTHLADMHFTCTEFARWRVYNLTGSQHVYNVGCSSIDVAKRSMSEPPVTAEELGGAGTPIDLTQPFGVILQHPVTNEADAAYQQMAITLEAAARVMLPWVVLWPGQDAGSAGISKAIRVWQDGVMPTFHTVRNLPPTRFLRLVQQASVLVGNSSCGIRECSYLGVPVVNIGTRQHGRERATNVVDVPHETDRILAALQRQIAHGRYPSSTLYGSGDTGQKIAEVLSGLCEGRVQERGDLWLHRRGDHDRLTRVPRSL